MKRRKFTSNFKFKVVIEALSERYTIQEIARKHQIHANQVSTWKSQFLKQGPSVFEKAKPAKSEAEEKEEQLLKSIGQLKVENDFLKKALS